MIPVKYSFILLAAIVLIAGCSTNPKPTPPPVAATSGTVVVVTTTPESMAGPSATTGSSANPAASSTPALSTAVPIPTLLPTVTVAAGTTAPRVASTVTKPAYKFPAPVLLGPSRPTVFKDGNSIKFTYASVGRLAANQCYLFHVEMINPNVNPGNRGDDFLDKDHCGDQSVSGRPLSFTLNNGKFRNAPNYGTILPQARDLAPLAPKQVLRVTWYIRVVQNNGLSSDNVHYQVIPLSAPSAVLDFDFEP